MRFKSEQTVVHDFGKALLKPHEYLRSTTEYLNRASANHAQPDRRLERLQSAMPLYVPREIKKNPRDSTQAASLSPTSSSSKVFAEKSNALVFKQKPRRCRNYGCCSSFSLKLLSQTSILLRKAASKFCNSFSSCKRFFLPCPRLWLEKPKSQYWLCIFQFH